MQKILRSGCVVVVIATIYTLTGCGGGSSSNSDTNDLSNIGAAFNAARTAAVIGDTGKEVMIVESGSVTWEASNGEDFVVYYDSNGLPTKSVLGDDVILYHWNTSSNTVDIGFVLANGTVTYTFGVVVSSTLISDLASLASSVNASLNKNAGSKAWSDSLQLSTVISFGSKLISAGICVGTVYTAVQSGGITYPAIGLACASTVYDVGVASGTIDESKLGSTVLTGIDVLQCAQGSAADCAAAGADIASTATAYAETVLSADAGQINYTQDIIDTGSAPSGSTLHNFGPYAYTDTPVTNDLYIPTGSKVYISNLSSSGTADGFFDCGYKGYLKINGTMIAYNSYYSPDSESTWTIYYGSGNGGAISTSLIDPKIWVKFKGTTSITSDNLWIEITSLVNLGASNTFYFYHFTESTKGFVIKIGS